MERKRLNQVQLATALGVSRSAVNAWINDRAYPMNSLGALEDVLGVQLGDEAPEPSVPSDKLRAQILEELGPERGEAFIAEMERRMNPPPPPPPAAQADPRERRPALDRPPGGSAQPYRDDREPAISP